jgi:SAM-dependent methyltransferase
MIAAPAVQSETPLAPSRSAVMEWDVETWWPALEFWQAHSRLDLSMSRVLEIGSRNGGLSLWLAANGASVTCSDLNGPTAAARSKHRIHRLDDRITYASIDATAIPHREAFDLVVFKSVLGGIGRDGRADRQQLAIDQMHAALRPGGELWFAENLTASPVHRLLRQHCTDWGGRWRYLALEELTGQLARFSDVTWESGGVVAAFGRTEPQRQMLARLDRALLNAITPTRWRYVGYGVARK